MAFICTVSLETFDPEIIEEGSSYSIVADVGADVAKGVDYKIVVGFEPVPGSDVMEFFFFILEVEQGTGSLHEYWSGRDTRFIKGADRKTVLTAIGAATTMLLSLKQPPTVDRVTHDGGLLRPALDKHRFIQIVFEKNGYEVIESGTARGNTFWRMQRR